MEYYVPGLTRELCGYSKIPDEDGDHFIKVKYVLKPIDLAYLQKLFSVDPDDPDPASCDLIYCYEINEVQAKALQRFVVGGFIIDLEKYDFQLECYKTKD